MPDHGGALCQRSASAHPVNGTIPSVSTHLRSHLRLPQLSPGGVHMPGTLHVIATPIGNLEDITLRALRLLREVALIAAEDTRRTAKLLQHYGINTPTLSYHEHNCRGRLPGLMRKLQEGLDLALVTDAGTPGMSDPGIELVDECLRGGVPVN